jgi:hypothetical protein
VSFAEAKAILDTAQREHAEADATKPHDPKRKQIKKVFGFFASRRSFGDQTFVLLAIERPPDGGLFQRHGDKLIIYRPNTGRKQMDFRELDHRYEPVDEKAAKRLWRENSDLTEATEKHYILTGGVLGTWALLARSREFGKIRVTRASTTTADGDGEQSILGISVPSGHALSDVLEMLSKHQGNTYLYLMTKLNIIKYLHARQVLPPRALPAVPAAPPPPQRPPRHAAASPQEPVAAPRQARPAVRVPAAPPAPERSPRGRPAALPARPPRKIEPKDPDNAVYW